MHEFLHVIGLCQDNLAHLDFLDIFISNYQEVINLTIKGYEKIKNLA